VIVSLKEGLFQNANVLFKVQFLDSRSTVKRIQVRKNNSNKNGDGNRVYERDDDDADVMF
jgi:hypothetical protein